MTADFFQETRNYINEILPAQADLPFLCLCFCFPHPKRNVTSLVSHPTSYQQEGKWWCVDGCSFSMAATSRIAGTEEDSITKISNLIKQVLVPTKLDLIVAHDLSQ